MTTTAQENTKTWHRTEYTFPSGDQCNCYRHKSKTGKSKRCPNRDCVIGLIDPDNPERGIQRNYCLDCWATCRDEKTEVNPSQRLMWQQNARDRMTPMAIGC